MGLFSKKEGGTFFGNLLRGVAHNIPVIGASLGNGGNKIEVGQTLTNAQIAGVTVGNYNASVANGGNPIAEKMAAQPPSVNGVMTNAGFPQQSAVFQTGQANNPTDLGSVSVSAQRLPTSTNFDLDWKNGTISTSNNQGSTNNNMLLYGMLGLGALMLLQKK